MIDTWTYDDLKHKLAKSKSLILLSNYIKPEFLTVKGKLLKSVKDAHIQGVYSAWEAFMLIYGSAVKEHNAYVFAKSDCVIFSTIKSN